MSAARVSEQARALTEHVFTCARAGEWYAAASRVDAVLDEARTGGYEAGLAAARRGVA